MMNGKSWRLGRIVNPRDGRTLILAMDHGVTVGPVLGLESPSVLFNKMRAAPPDALILHKGLVRFLPQDLAPRVGLIVHLSAGTALGSRNRKVLVTEVEEAVSLGADGVSIHVNFGGPSETNMLEDLGRTAGCCNALGIPLLAMAYVRGGGLKETDGQALAVAARAWAELGADIVKIPWPESHQEMAEIVAGCPVGVVVAGGARNESPGFLQQRVAAALSVGAVGVAAGRNVFRAGDPATVLQDLRSLIHGQRSSIGQKSRRVSMGA
jgi:DhnA family fructose-bisphosphate aldolase class Ia